MIRWLLLGCLLLTIANAAEPAGSRGYAVEAEHAPELKAATDLFARGEHAEAAAAFERLYPKTKLPRLLLWIAVIKATKLSGRCAGALDAMARFDQVCVDCASRKAGVGVRAQVEAACTGTLSVTTIPAEAAIRVGDGAPGVSPFSAAVVIGEHVVSAALPGYQIVEAPIVIEPGETLTLELVLEKLATPADRRYAEGKRLMNAGRFGEAAAQYAQGEEAAAEPRFALGQAQAQLAMGACQPANAALQRFEAQCTACALAFAGRSTRASWRAACVKPVPAEAPGPWRWIGLGVGISGVLTGALFASRYVDATDARDAADRRGESIVELKALHAEAVDEYRWMQVGFVAGGLGLATAVTLWLIEDDGAEPGAGLHAGPGGFGVSGRF